jgi:hypothetical protein
MVGSALGVLGAAGVLLVIFGVRGRRVGDHPTCRVCGFDLTGGATRCPECGGDPGARGPRIGTRRRRPWLVVAGLALCVLGGGGLGAMSWARAARFDWNRVKPVALLRREVALGWGASGAAAMAELERRQAAGTLSQGQVVAVAESILKVQADKGRQWDERLGGWVERAWQDGTLGEPDFRRYLRHAAEFQISTRPRIEESEMWLPMEVVRLGVRAGPAGNLGGNVYGPALRVEERFSSVAVDGLPAGPKQPRPGNSGALTPYRSGFTAPLAVRAWDAPPLPRGRHGLKIVYEVTISIAGARPCAETFEVPCEATFEVVGRGGDAVEMVSDPALDARMQASLSEVGPAWFLGRAWGFMGYGSVRVQPLPEALAAEIYWRQPDGAEFRVGELVLRPSGQAGLHQYATQELPETIAAGPIEVILRASPEVARRTTDLSRIWGGELNLGTTTLKESTNGVIRWPE